MVTRIALFIGIFAAIAVAFAFVRPVEESLKIDSCLDQGGCWDYGSHVCRKEEANAQLLCNVSKQPPSTTCDCLLEGQDPWLCGSGDDPIPFDTPNRDAIVAALVEGHLIALNCKRVEE